MKINAGDKPLEPMLVLDVPAKQKAKKKAPLPKIAAKSISVIRVPISPITQQDLIEYLSYEILLARKRESLIRALSAGVPVEDGVHTAHLDSKLNVR